MGLSICVWAFSLVFISFRSPSRHILSLASDVSCPLSDPFGPYNLAQQALISKSHLLSFTLLCSSHHPVTPWTPEGGNYPCPRRTEQHAAGVRRPHMHPLIRAPIFIHHPQHYPGSLLAPLLWCVASSGPPSKCVCLCVLYVPVDKYQMQIVFTFSIQLRVSYWYIYPLKVELYAPIARDCMCICDRWTNKRWYMQLVSSFKAKHLESEPAIEALSREPCD